MARKNITPIIEAITGLSGVNSQEGLDAVVKNLESLKSGQSVTSQSNGTSAKESNRRSE